jgi:uncharacterized oligopeptide transporter (OPT) family protein
MTDTHAPSPGEAAAEAHQPLVPASESPAEFTLKACAFGVVFGILFGAANAYLGLGAGLTISTSSGSRRVAPGIS